MEKVTIKDLTFRQFIKRSDIEEKIKQLARQINTDYEGKNPVFLPVLNGSFMFSSDLIKQISIPCKVSFVKVSSYVGTVSSGSLKSLIGLEESLFNQDVIVVEDIIDSGLTLERIVAELKALGAKTAEVVTLLRKRPARERGIHARYVGFEIEDEFVLGYGLDYEGLGRNHNEIFMAEL